MLSELHKPFSKLQNISVMDKFSQAIIVRLYLTLQQEIYKLTDNLKCHETSKLCIMKWIKVCCFVIFFPQMQLFTTEI